MWSSYATLEEKVKELPAGAHATGNLSDQVQTLSYSDTEAIGLVSAGPSRRTYYKLTTYLLHVRVPPRTSQVQYIHQNTQLAVTRHYPPFSEDSKCDQIGRDCYTSNSNRPRTSASSGDGTDCADRRPHVKAGWDGTG